LHFDGVNLCSQIVSSHTTEVIALIYSVVVTVILSFGFNLFNNMQGTVKQTKDISNEFENQYNKFISGKNDIKNSIYFSDIIMDVSQTSGYFADFDKQSAELKSRRIVNLKGKLIIMESYFIDLRKILEKYEILSYQKRILIESFNNILLSIDTILDRDRVLKNDNPQNGLFDQKDINDLSDCKNKCIDCVEKIRAIPESDNRKITKLHKI